MREMENLSLLLKKVDLDPEPAPDIAVCSECGGRYPVEQCDVDPYGDGDWEAGYHPTLLCPSCEDGGCIDDFEMSPKRLELWYAWRDRNRNRS